MFDQTWCVFKKDSFPSDDFNDAVRVAKKNGVRIAYTNEVFELWYLLHFCYCDTAIIRQDYKDRLSEHMNHKYCKNSETIFDEIFERQKLAIQNAKRLLKTYNPSKPCDDNPSTTVHLLVEQLNRFSQ